MQNQAVVDYIKKARESGMTDEQIKTILYKNGWTEQDVAENMAEKIVEQTVEQKPETSVPIQRPIVTQAKPQQRASTVMPSQRKKSPIIIALVVLLLLLIVGGGSFAYVLWSRVYDPAWNPFRPTSAKVMGYLLANMQAVKTFDEKVNGEFSILDNAGKITAKVIFDATGKNDLSDTAAPKMDYNFNLQLKSLELATLASASGQAIIVGNSIYIKLVSISTGALASADTPAILGKWFEVDQNSFSTLTAELGLSQNMQISPKIESLLFFKKPMSVVRDLGDQGVKYHYLIQPNTEVLIGKNDYMLSSYKFDKISADISNFNEPVAIAAPLLTTKIEATVLPILRAQKIKNDVAQISAVAQSVFSAKNSHASLCSRGLLNGYEATVGSDLISLNNSLLAKGAKKPVCFAGVADFCISTQLADGSFLCAGKTVSVGKTKCVSATTQCQQ